MWAQYRGEAEECGEIAVVECHRLGWGAAFECTTPAIAMHALVPAICYVIQESVCTTLPQRMAKDLAATRKNPGGRRGRM